ncbi:hypothetical protein WICMUC_004569 [Wickerhamomyces mucosus]|uniref:Uncharacterized protein n=1 Tax=Wickerhamomyces mucosus TaxID=1378264 RepID=A0A9P8T9W6_9ASCO|nr:hypothetical protein WICMUC_004569 [Wickerhamomyces mucosus]
MIELSNFNFEIINSKVLSGFESFNLINDNFASLYLPLEIKYLEDSGTIINPNNPKIAIPTQQHNGIIQHKSLLGNLAFVRYTVIEPNNIPLTILI